MWVVITLASLAIILILVLCVPFDVVLHANVYGKPKFQMRLAWLFGLVTREIRKGEKKPEEKKKAVEGKQKPKKRKVRFRGIFEILRIRGLLKQFKTLIMDVLSQLKIRDFTADFRAGLGDPADTGLLFAFIGPATALLNHSFPNHIRVQPSFEDEAVFEGYSYGVTRLRPIQLVIPSLRFIFSLAAVRVVKKLVLSKWKRKR